MTSKCFEYDGLMYYFSIAFTPARGWHNLELVRVLSGDRIQIKTRAASGYAIKINKSGVSADGGALGVFNFLNDCIKNDFAMCYVRRVCELFA